MNKHNKTGLQTQRLNRWLPEKRKLEEEKNRWDRLKVKAFIAQSSLTLYNPKDCSPPGSSVHGILQARILEWVAIPVSRGSSRPRDQTQVSCIAGKFFTK